MGDTAPHRKHQQHKGRHKDLLLPSSGTLEGLTVAYLGIQLWHMLCIKIALSQLEEVIPFVSILFQAPWTIILLQIACFRRPGLPLSVCLLAIARSKLYTSQGWPERFLSDGNKHESSSTHSNILCTPLQITHFLCAPSIPR